MQILEKLKERWHDIDYPFLIHSTGVLRFSEITKQKSVDLSEVKSGDVVALIGDFDPQSILTLLQLIDKDVILAPLTVDTRFQHEYFFEAALVDVVIDGDEVKRKMSIVKMRHTDHMLGYKPFNWKNVDNQFSIL